MRFFRPSHHGPERLLWSRDSRYVKRLRIAVPSGRVLDLDSGTCFIAEAAVLPDAVAADVASRSHHPEYGLVDIDERLPEPDRYLVALSLAVQSSGIADRIGMAQTTQVIEGKTLDYFFNLRNNHQVVFQPIVDLATGRLHEYECLFRPVMPMLPQSISAIVQAAIDTARSVELDAFIVRMILARAGEIVSRWPSDEPPPRFSINFTPASLLDSRFEARAFASMTRQAGLVPSLVTVECTEQQSVSDVEPLKREVKALRRLGFGFAIDDAGAGYASFTLIATLRPSIIKIDRQIVHGIGTHDARQALVEAFVSFSRRIGAQLVAEGIETRKELTTLQELGVQLGQGYLLGRPSPTPQPPRRADPVWSKHRRSGGSTRVTATQSAEAAATTATSGG